MFVGKPNDHRGEQGTRTIEYECKLDEKNTFHAKIEWQFRAASSAQPYSWSYILRYNDIPVIDKLVGANDTTNPNVSSIQASVIGAQGYESLSLYLCGNDAQSSDKGFDFNHPSHCSLNYFGIKTGADGKTASPINNNESETQKSNFFFNKQK